MIKNARTKPSPFIVVNVKQSLIYDWKSLLKKLYGGKKCTFKIQEIKEICVSRTYPSLMNHRLSYNGSFLSSVITNKPPKNVTKMKPGEFELPLPVYNGLLPISKAKYQDIMSLLKFCGPSAVNFFHKLRYE
ncbi:hypothetical protein ABEB36_014515 [Hypothenemus hampei]|uniref:Uncharacterized protein n=1 Tax=Hypothenemus hampei TaxID=57062 RepID=A0ABD1E2W5_HYPHA